jgi:hypothetical protein
MGVANMFDRYRYRDRIVVADLDATMAVDDPVDIVLYDSFAQPESDTTRSVSWSPIRVHAEWWSTPETFTRTSSPACANTERTGICQRHCRYGCWSPCSGLCIPARWSPATFRHAGAAPWALTGPGGA